VWSNKLYPAVLLMYFLFLAFFYAFVSVLRFYSHIKVMGYQKYYIILVEIALGLNLV